MTDQTPSEVSSDTPVKLEACPDPWCRDSKPALMQGGFRNRHFRVECQSCFTKGPMRGDLSGGGPAAIAAWNTRADDATIASLRAQLAEKDEAFIRYGGHDRDCLSRKGANYGEESCDCGLATIRTALGASK